jgi:hypothetical protein
MGFCEDLATLFAEQAVVALDGDVFIGLSAVIPDGDGPYLIVVETSGTGPEYRQDVAGPSMEMPGAQVVARGLDRAAARSLAWAAWVAASRVRNRTIGSVWYRSVNVVQSPFELGLDATGRRARFVFNVIGDKKPS